MYLPLRLHLCSSCGSKELRMSGILHSVGYLVARFSFAVLLEREHQLARGIWRDFRKALSRVAHFSGLL